MEGKKLKILMTVDTLGGVWNYAMDLCFAMRNYPVQFHVATLGSYLNKYQRDQAKSAANIVLYESGYKLEWMKDPWSELDKACLWVKDICAYIKPHIIHFNNYGLAHYDWKIPVLLVAHSCVLSWWEAVKQEEAPPEWNRYRSIVAQALMKADIVISPTQAFLNDLERIYGNILHKKVIHNSRAFPKTMAQKKEPLILSAGRVWDEAKNLQALMDIAHRLDWPVYIAGETMHPVTRESIEANNVHFLGVLQPFELQEWMNRASIFAHPAKYEPFGLSVLEAAHSGCALLLGDTPSLRELWDDAAVFADQRNPQAITVALNKLIKDDSRRSDFGKKARERSLRYDIRNMASEYYNVYRNLVPEFPKIKKTIAESKI